MVQFTNFWSRLLAASVGIVFSLFCFLNENKLFTMIYWGGILFISIGELCRIMKLSNDALGANVTAQCIIYIYTSLWYQEASPRLIFVFVIGVSFITTLFEERDPSANLSPIWACAWITYPCYLCYSYTVEDPIFMIGFLCAVWFMDAGAYFSGHIFGRTPLLQAISPRKTWEGVIGGAFVVMIVVYVCAILIPSYEQSTWIAIGLISIIFGQIGDLFESLIKRVYGAKDSGGFLLGHGGILDRYDSVFLSIIVTHLYLSW